MDIVISIIIVSVLSLSGIFLGIKASSEDKSVTLGADAVSVKKIIRIAAFYGVSTSLLFFGIIMTGGIFDGSLSWSVEKISGAILVSVILGLVVSLGSTYQIYITSRYKDGLEAYLKKKNK